MKSSCKNVRKNRNMIKDGKEMRDSLNRMYEIMHMDKKVADINPSGICHIYEPDFLPYNLYLEEETDIDALVNNLTNFYYWCASRVLTLDRKYAKEILNSIGMTQAVTDRDRAKIALSYRCASLTDVFWVQEAGENISFAEVNLYDNHLNNTFIDIALRGRQYTVSNEMIAKDLSTNGCFAKAWKRKDDGFYLLKDGGREAVEKELLASQICRRFALSQVLYERSYFDGEEVSVSKNFTSKEYSIASMEHFQIYAANHEINEKDYILFLDKHNYYMMNIIDYLIGNTDRHWGNWGVLVDNTTNQPVALHPLMDFNQAFQAYDTLSGANCQTLFGEKATQQEAAVAAVRMIGLNQLEEIDTEKLFEKEDQLKMFEKRFAFLKSQ